MSQRWSNALNEGQEARAIALDFSKAFDKCSFEAVLFKLERIGISGPLLQWFRSYLTDRKQRVVVGTASSPYAPVTSGVPQGSVLAPILFLVMINDAFDVVENHLDVFADDSTLWAVIPGKSRRKAVAASLEKDLAALNAWAKRWLMQFNHSKTELLTISNKKDVQSFRKNGLNADGHYKLDSDSNPNPHPLLRFGESVLPEAATAKVVGLTFSSNLSWLPHINTIAKHANKAISILTRARKFLTTAALASIYKSHVRSRMEYLSPIWSGALTKSTLGHDTAPDRLDRIQTRAAKLIGPEEAIKLHELSHRRGVSGLCFIHRLLHGTAPSAVLDLLPPRAPAPTRPSRHSNKAGGTPFFARPSARQTDNMSWINSCVPLFTRTFNALPPAIQSIPSLQAFKVAANKSVDLTFHAITASVA